MGIGIIGVFQSVIDMARSTYSLGMDTAGVREIAEKKEAADNATLERTISRFNIWFLFMALLAMVTCVFLCFPISDWAFGNEDYAGHIAGLSVCIFFAILTTGRSTVLQGLRKIPEMAKTSVWSSFLVLVFTIPVYYIWGIGGIIPAFIIAGSISFFCVEHYYRKQHIPMVNLPVKTAFLSGLNTLKLGLYIVVGGIIGTVSMFLIRAFITKNIDVESTGLFQAAWVITNVYLGLILRSMGSDFFPRLSAIISDKKSSVQLVNEQSHIVLVIASPIITGLILFSGFILTILYSSEFLLAENILRWQILGTFLKVLSWPVAFIMLAKNKGFIFLMTEFIFYAAYLLSAYLLFPRYGVDASGIGYLIAYVVYFPVVFVAGYKISGFYWNRNVIIMALVNLSLICLAFYIAYYYPGKLLWSIPLFAISLAYAIYNLRKVFSIDDLKSWFRKE